MRCICTMLQQLLQLCKLTLSSSLEQLQIYCGRLQQVKQCINSGVKLRGVCALQGKYSPSQSVNQFTAFGLIPGQAQ